MGKVLKRILKQEEGEETGKLKDVKLRRAEESHKEGVQEVERII